MANRRMFSKEIIDSDMFLDMPLSTQALYFHLSMRADDDGFVNNPKKIQRMVGGSDDDAKILLAKKFILSFDSGIIVIKHWKLHNYIQKDRYKPSTYTYEKALLGEKENGAYTLDTRCIQNGDSGKVRKEIGEVRKENIVDYSQHENINQKSANEWFEYKKYKSKVPITKCLNFLNKYDTDTQKRIIDTSIMNGWKGLFEPKNYGVENHKTKKQSSDEFIDSYFYNMDQESTIEGEILQ